MSILRPNERLIKRKSDSKVRLQKKTRLASGKIGFMPINESWEVFTPVRGVAYIVHED